MKTIEDFTPEIQAKIPEYIAKYTEGIYDGKRFERFVKKNAIALIDWNYIKSGYVVPITLVAENPLEATLMFNWIEKNQNDFIKIYEANASNTDVNNMVVEDEIIKRLNAMKSFSDLSAKRNMYLFTTNIWSNAYAAYYKFIKDEFKLDVEIGPTLDEWNDLYMASNVYNAIFTESVCVVSKYPKKINVDEESRLHSTDGPACVWNQRVTKLSFDGYFIHGRQIEKELMEKCVAGKYTRKDFMAETNSDAKGAVYEIMGGEKIMNMLGAVCISTAEIKHHNKETEVVQLFKTKETFEELEGQPFAWVKFTCPSTGTNYLIDVEPHFTDALKAAVSTSPLFTGEDEYKFDARS